MGRCARLAWDHAVEDSNRSPIARPGVTTAHILLGVLKEETCAGGLILGKMGLNFSLAKALTEFVLQYGRRRDAAEVATVEWAGVPHTPAGKTALGYSLEEANLFTATYPIGTEHLLLGVLRVPEGMGARVMNYLGIEEASARATRDEIWAILRSEE